MRRLSLDVQDESHQHAGHSGSRPGGETHYRVNIVSEAFQGKSRIERHRMVNTALAQELAGGVHALAIHAVGAGGAIHKIATAGTRPAAGVSRDVRTSAQRWNGRLTRGPVNDICVRSLVKRG